MAAKRNSVIAETKQIEILKDPLQYTYWKRFPYELDEEQKEYIKAIFNEKNIGVFVNAKAGTSKTSVAVGCGLLMTNELRMFDKMYYIINPTVEVSSIGMLPGDFNTKCLPMRTALDQAILQWGYDPSQIIVSDDDMEAQKFGSAKVIFTGETFMRGQTIDNAFIIVDEFENYDMRKAKKVLTRVGKNTKVIVLGCSSQCDLKYPSDSALPKYMNAVTDCDFVTEVKLTKVYRSKFCAWADGVN